MYFEYKFCLKVFVKLFDGKIVREESVKMKTEILSQVGRKILRSPLKDYTFVPYLPCHYKASNLKRYYETNRINLSYPQN